MNDKLFFDTNAILYFLSDAEIENKNINLDLFIPLITNDKQLFKIEEINVMTYEEFKRKYTK
ncbi:hypothetical protein SAMN06265182_0596 [Persephonella hydrogeniphila]|uniref:PIN domain-containing protein n=1 Tax=Persephonella hydrogeniphila TaxID=198703 RepID=A0A285N9N4_9AQUI|nr:hypothetical protein [Persephonella hydrogeniphila]SNZ06202.1 hypothetical protein SAMN06265182_0596 [Persephonella hydrogeniphila]